MYSELVSRVMGFAGAGPREDLLGRSKRHPDMSMSANIGSMVFQTFGPLIVAFLAGLLFVGLFQVEFAQFSNWYIRIIFTLSILLHLLFLLALASELGIWGVLLTIVSFAFTVLQILAALSLVQIVFGVEAIDNTLLQTYREFILNLVTLAGGAEITDETIASSGEMVTGAAYKYGYDVMVQLGAAAVLGTIGAIAKSAAN